MNFHAKPIWIENSKAAQGPVLSVKTRPTDPNNHKPDALESLEI
jgi:hypothetical protein